MTSLAFALTSTSIFFAVGAEADEEKLEFLLAELKDKDITEVIAAGREKFASVPSGGGMAMAAPAAAAGGGAAPAEEAKKEEKEEEKEESDDVSFFFTWQISEAGLSYFSHPLMIFIFLIPVLQTCLFIFWLHVYNMGLN
jgi:large subunit ribosomal protein LP2